MYEREGKRHREKRDRKADFIGIRGEENVKGTFR